MKWMKEIFTEAKERPEIKNLLGVPATALGLVAGLLRLCGVFSFAFTDWAVFMGIATGLLVTSAVADGLLDSAKGK